MAIAIKSIPTLRGEDAKRFNDTAKKAERKRATVDFSGQAKITRKILEKAKML
jgi:hypothetical protein